MLISALIDLTPQPFLQSVCGQAVVVGRQANLTYEDPSSYLDGHGRAGRRGGTGGGGRVPGWAAWGGLAAVAACGGVGGSGAVEAGAGGGGGGGSAAAPGCGD